MVGCSLGPASWLKAPKNPICFIMSGRFLHTKQRQFDLYTAWSKKPEYPLHPLASINIHVPIPSETHRLIRLQHPFFLGRSWSHGSNVVLFNKAPSLLRAGGDEIAWNLIFSSCRESGDHGPFNSWDRQPFLTRVRTGEPSMWPSERGGQKEWSKWGGGVVVNYFWWFMKTAKAGMDCLKFGRFGEEGLA